MSVAIDGTTASHAKDAYDADFDTDVSGADDAAKLCGVSYVSG